MAADQEGARKGTVIGLEKEILDITNAIERFGTGAPDHIAIISEPMGGRSTIVSEIRRLHGDKVHYLPLEFVISPDSLPDFSTIKEDIILIDNCRFLATRRIGGFDVLDAFLHAQISSKKLFITTWNAFAWQYLSAVMNIESYFPVIVSIARMDTPVLKQVILSHHGQGKIRFLEEGATDRSMFYSLIHKNVHIPLTKKDISLPWIKSNFTVMLRGLPRKKHIQVSIEDVIFEKINRIARGNPGVALLLWESSLNENTISLASIRETPYDIDLDTNESFILTIILSMKSLHEKDLAAIAGSEMDIQRVLYRLVQQDIVREDAGYFSIPPFALGPVIEYLKKTRRLW